jgi:CRP/FNR family transcriptional regulator
MEKDTNIIDLSDHRVECKNCSLFQLCLPLGLREDDVTQLEKIVLHRKPVKRGEFLFRGGDTFRSIYAVKSGSIKTCTYTEDGLEEITGFHLAGELLGLDAINSGRHCVSAQALERSTLCEIPFNKLESLGDRLPELLHQMVRIMSKDIQREKSLCHLGNKSAEGRLATFLLSLSSRYRERGFSATEFRLSMSRADIANYLGLAVETISRLFSRFQKEGLLEARAREIRLLDLSGLKAIASDYPFECGSHLRNHTPNH